MARLPTGTLTENGRFFQAVDQFKSGDKPARLVQVYEKIATGIWCDRGRHELVDAELKKIPLRPGGGGGRGSARPGVARTRQVCRFYLRPAAGCTHKLDREEERELTISRVIPTAVKVEVWRRDQGRCVTCGATDNLHFDHDVPYSKGGSSITAANVRLLCIRHNLSKGDKIMTLGPLLGPLLGVVVFGISKGA